MTPSPLVVAPEAFATAAAHAIADAIVAAVATRGSCAIALAGGSTPVPVYHALAPERVPWHEVAIYFGDERAVPPTDPESNYAMARQALLDRLAVPPLRIHRMAADAADGSAAAAAYDRLLPARLDLLLLGVGPDGHTASLFPHSAALAETERRVVVAAAPPPPLQPQVPRMTITPPVIGAARQVIVLVRGPEKAALVARILEGPLDPSTLPAQLARDGSWILDQEAAGRLARGAA